MQKIGKIGLLLIALTIALSSMGVSYACWKNGGWSYGWSNRGWSNHGWSNHGWSNRGWSNYGWNYRVQCEDCQVEFMSANSSDPGATIDPSYDKHVASTEVSISNGSNSCQCYYNYTLNKLVVTVDNAYPSYLPTVYYQLKSESNRYCANITDIKIDEDPMIAGVPYLYQGAIVVAVNPPQIIRPCQPASGNMTIHIEQEAEQRHTYEFTVTMGYECIPCAPCEEECETAYAYGCRKYATCFLDMADGLKNPPWGWTNGPLSAGNYTFDLYAGAAKCSLRKGTKVGTVTVNYYGSTVTVIYSLDEGTMDATHLYVGNDPLPEFNGKPTVSSGHYPYQHDLEDATSDNYTISGLSGTIYVIAHAVVCELE